MKISKHHAKQSQNNHNNCTKISLIITKQYTITLSARTSCVFSSYFVFSCRLCMRFHVLGERAAGGRSVVTLRTRVRPFTRVGAFVSFQGASLSGGEVAFVASVRPHLCVRSHVLGERGGVSRSVAALSAHVRLFTCVGASVCREGTALRETLLTQVAGKRFFLCMPGAHVAAESVWGTESFVTY